MNHRKLVVLTCLTAKQARGAHQLEPLPLGIFGDLDYPGVGSVPEFPALPNIVVCAPGSCQ